MQNIPPLLIKNILAVYHWVRWLLHCRGGRTWSGMIGQKLSVWLFSGLYAEYGGHILALNSRGLVNNGISPAFFAQRFSTLLAVPNGGAQVLNELEITFSTWMPSSHAILRLVSYRLMGIVVLTKQYGSHMIMSYNIPPLAALGYLSFVQYDCTYIMILFNVQHSACVCVLGLSVSQD